jgi:hypothetical protein
MRTPFTGVGTALVSPFTRGGSLDEAAVRRLGRRQIEAGVHFLCPCGTTGESPTLTDAEKVRTVEILVEGFMDDPFYVWTTPGETARRALLESMFEVAVDAADEQGFLQLDERGVAILVPPGRELYDGKKAAQQQELIRKAFHRSSTLLDDYRLRLRSADPEPAGCWYLAYLAVPASKRCRGSGTSIMKDILAQTAGTPMRLHTGRPSVLGFYEKFGLKVIAVTPCELDGPLVYTLEGRPGESDARSALPALPVTASVRYEYLRLWRPGLPGFCERAGRPSGSGSCRAAGQGVLGSAGWMPVQWFRLMAFLCVMISRGGRRAGPGAASLT